MKLCYVLILVCGGFACNSGPSEKDQIRHEISSVDNVEEILVETLSKARAVNFFDSVYLQMDLSTEQMISHTNLDTSFYTRSENILFTGDTAFMVRKTYKAVIVAYSDGLVCQQKFIFLFNRDSLYSHLFKEIFTQCDADLSRYYETTDFKFTSDTSFELIKKRYPPEDKQEKEKEKTEISKFIITADGRIVATRDRSSK
ncbi:MAG: hypothetical protein J7578_18995 [Chitinophagaceae bacterium]|nr:hypothetical protein [Chitinophagaceae bacterium]